MSEIDNLRDEWNIAHDVDLFYEVGFLMSGAKKCGLTISSIIENSHKVEEASKKLNITFDEFDQWYRQCVREAKVNEIKQKREAKEIKDIHPRHRRKH